MTNRRPRIYGNSRPALSTEERVAALEQRVPSSGGGGGGYGEPWELTGDGSSTTFAIPERASIDPLRYRVEVGGVPQPPAAFTLPEDTETIVFAEAPPAGVPILVYPPAGA